MNEQYLTTAEYAEKIGLKRRRVQVLAKQGRIPGARKVGRDWLIPANAKPTSAERGPRGRWEGEEEEEEGR